MKIIKPTTHLVDIGPLDYIRRFPMAGRIKYDMKTICRRCGKPVTDEYFIGGFKKGFPNMIFHESCIEGGRDDET